MKAKRVKKKDDRKMKAKERLKNEIFFIFLRIEQQCDHNGRFKKKTNLRMEKEEKKKGRKKKRGRHLEKHQEDGRKMEQENMFSIFF